MLKFYYKNLSVSRSLVPLVSLCKLFVHFMVCSRENFTRKLFLLYYSGVKREGLEFGSLTFFGFELVRNDKNKIISKFQVGQT